MSKLLVTGVIAFGAAAVAIPTALAIASAPTFAQQIPVPRPSHAASVSFDRHGRVTVSDDKTGGHHASASPTATSPTSATATSPSATSPTSTAAGEDNGHRHGGRDDTPGHARASASEPGDDHGGNTEPGDDRGGRTSSPSTTSGRPTSVRSTPGNDDPTTHDAGDDHGGNSGRGRNGSSGSGSGDNGGHHRRGDG